MLTDAPPRKQNSAHFVASDSRNVIPLPTRRKAGDDRPGRISHWRCYRIYNEVLAMLGLKPDACDLTGLDGLQRNEDVGGRRQQICEAN